MQDLATVFRVSVSIVHRTIHKVIPLMHVEIVPKFVKWHSARRWHQLAGTYPQWPHVVGILDGTPFRISKPSGISCNVQAVIK